MQAKAEEVAEFCAQFAKSDWREARIVIGEMTILVSKDPDAPGLLAEASDYVCAEEKNAEGGAGASPAHEIIRAPSFGTLRFSNDSLQSCPSVGECVAEGDVIAMIEVLGERQAVSASVAGTITEILGKPDALIDFDAAILSIRPLS